MGIPSGAPEEQGRMLSRGRSVRSLFLLGPGSRRSSKRGSRRAFPRRGKMKAARQTCGCNRGAGAAYGNLGRHRFLALPLRREATLLSLASTFLMTRWTRFWRRSAWRTKGCREFSQRNIRSRRGSFFRTWISSFARKGPTTWSTGFGG